MHIVHCVTNDIHTDRRVCRIAQSLVRYGYKVTVIGRTCKQKADAANLSFSTFRIRLLFNKGPLFYMEYNLRLLFYLLFIHADIIVANDLDTLAAVYFASRIRKKIVLYDSHEYFTEVPELIGRNVVKKIWEMLERTILPKLRYAYTVSNSIADAYHRKYGIHMRVIRNMPWRLQKPVHIERFLKTGNEKVILYQGSLNKGRGLELAIHAVTHMYDVKLVIIGTGDVEHELKNLVARQNLQHKVLFLGRIPQDDLSRYTIQADIGISLEEHAGLNYYYALPNKLFDYIQAEIPVVVSDLPEIASVVRSYKIGMINKTHDPEKLASLFDEMLHDKMKRELWKDNLKEAAKELCWEHEEESLIELYRNAVNVT